MESIPRLHKRLKIRALFCVLFRTPCFCRTHQHAQYLSNIKVCSYGLLLCTRNSQKACQGLSHRALLVTLSCSPSSFFVFLIIFVFFLFFVFFFFSLSSSSPSSSSPPAFLSFFFYRDIIYDFISQYHHPPPPPNNSNL